MAVTLEQVDQLGCKFSFMFKLDATSIGYHVSVEFKPKKPCHKKFFSFLFFVDDCDPPVVEPLIETSKYKASGVAGDSYFFKGSIVNEDEDGNCRLFTFRWKCWQRSAANPVNPLSGSGDYKGLLGKAIGELEETPDWSGEQLFKVCCIKSKEGGCELSCSKI